MNGIRVYALLFVCLAFQRVSAQITVNVPAGGDVAGASLKVLQAGGGTINLAAGNYYITGSIVLGSNTTINGAGGPGSATQSVIYAPASPNAISMVTQAYPGASNLTISNLVLDGNIPQAAMLYGTGNGNYAYNNNGIYIYSQSNTTVGVTITNVEVRHTLRGILTGLVDNLTISGCYFHDNNPGGFSHNMYLVATSGVEIDHTRSNNALTGDGLHIDFGGNGYTIRKSEFTGNNGLGLLSQNDNNVTVEDTKFDFNTNEGIQINAGGLLLTRDETSDNGGYGLQIPSTADGAGLVYGFYSYQNDPLNSGGDFGPNYVYQAAEADYTEYHPGPNDYPAIQADGVLGVADTGDWTLNYGGYTYLGAVDFNANHLSNGSITFQVGNAVAAGSYPLVIRYSNGTSSNQTMNLSINGRPPVPVNFAPTGSYSTWSTTTTSGNLNVGNNAVTLSVPTGATSAPELDLLSVTAAAPPAPNAPTNVTAVANGPYSVTLSWTPPANSSSNAAQTYNIYKNNTVPIVATKITGTTWTDTRIFYGETTNSYFVTAVNQGGESGASNSVTVTTGIDAPPGLQVSVVPHTPANNLNWLGVSGASLYLVKRSTVSGGPYQTMGTVPANTPYPSYSDTSLSNGQTYYYVVAAEDSNNNISANSYEVVALPQTFTLSASAPSVNLSSLTLDTILVVGTNGFSDAVNFAVSGLPTGVAASLSATAGSSTQITFTANTSATIGSYPVTITGTDGGLTSSVSVTVVISTGQLAQTITFNPIPQQSVGNSLAVFATASSGLPVSFFVVPNGNCSISGNVVTFLNGGTCGVVATQAGNAAFSAAANVGQVVQVGAPIGQTITFNAIPTQNAGTTLTLTATTSSGLPVSYTSATQNVCTISGSMATLLAAGTCTITASQTGAGQYGPAASITQSFTVTPSLQVPTDLTSARFAPNCGAANVTQIFADGFLASGQAGVNNLQDVSDPDVVLIGNQWWLIFASNPGPTRGLEPVAAYLPPGVSLSHTGVYPADPNGWHLVGANATDTGKGVAIDGTVSPAGWDTIAAETPSINVGPDGTVSVYYAGHNLGNTNFEIGMMSNVVNGIAASIDAVPAMVATQPWEFDNGLGAVLEQSVRWEPELNKFIMYYTAKGWWDNPPTNDIAYAESTDGITWTNRQHLGFPVSYYNQDFLFNPQWNRYEMVVSNDPTGAGGSNGRDLVWLDSAGPGTSYGAWQNQVTLLDHTSPGTPTWRDMGLLSPAIKYGNLPGEENRIYVFFHAYGSADPMSIGRFYCDAITTNPGYTVTSGAPFMDLAPGASAAMPITVNPTNGFTGTVNFTVSGAPAGVTASLVSSSSSTGTTLNVTVGANTAQGRYPITVTGTSGSLTREATFTLNVSGLSQTITIQPLSPNNISYTPGLTYTINASSSSGLPVTLSVGGNGTLNGNVLTLIGGGDIIIAANQAGNGTYSPAPQATTTLVVAPEVQTVNVASIPAQVVGGTLDLSKYVSTTSGLTSFSYTNQTPTVCTNNGSLLTFTSVGQCTIIAINFGNQFYAPAGADAFITVNQATQTITFGAIASQTAGVSIPLTATASSGLAVSFTSTTPTVCTVSGSSASLLTGGTCSIVASQAGNSNYGPAPSVAQSFAVANNVKSQTITFTPTSPLTYGVAPVLLNGTATSGLAVSYSFVSGPGTLSGNTLTVTGAGTIVIAANQAGNSSYSAAMQVSATIVVNKATPTITWATPSAITYGTALSSTQLNAIAAGVGGSTLAGTFTYSPVSGTTPAADSDTLSVSFVPTDTSDYISPVTATTSLTVNQASQTITFAPATPVTYGVSPIALTATGGASGSPITFTLLSGPGNLSGSTLTVTGAGTIVLAANQAGNSSYTAATQVTTSIVVNPASQTITFNTIPAQTVNTTLNLSGYATASSGLPVTWTYVNNGNCTISGNIVSFLNTGACGIIANQAGNSNYSAAASVGQVVLVNNPQPQTITFAPASPVTYGVSPIALTASGGGSGNPVTFTLVSGPGSLSGSTLTVNGAGTIVIAANQAASSNGKYSAAAQVTASIVVNPATQTITFAPASPVTYGVSPIALTGTGGASGNPVTFTLVSGPGSLSGSTLTVTGAGTIVIAANQPGTSNYSAAAQVTASIVVNPASQTINFAPPSAVTFGVSPITLTASGGSSGNPVTFTVVSGPGTLTGSMLTVTGAGTIVVAANQAGNTSYSAATQVSTSIVVNKATPTITWATPSAITYGTALSSTQLNAVAAGVGGTNLAGTFAYAPLAGTIPAVGSDPLSVSFVPTDTADYSSPVSATTNLTVNTASQTITFAPATPITYGVSPITLTATGGASGNPVNFTLVSGPGTLSGSSLTITGAGTIVVAANQAGNSSYSAATQVTASIVVNPASQTITFNAIPAQTAGGTVTLTATASSGLAVSFASSTPSVCTVSGSTATLLTGGTCSIVASQAGNGNYSPAPSITQSFTVAPAGTFTISLGSTTITLMPNNGVADTLTVNPLNGFTGAVTLSLTGLPAGVSGSFYPSNPTTSSTNLVVYVPMGTAPGSYPLTVTGVSGSLTVSTPATLVVQGTQTITFAAIPAQTVGSSLTLNATASSGLAVSYSSSTPSVCTVSGSTVTLVAAGTCTVTATQTGNTVYTAATPVTQSFTVASKQQSQTINFNAIATQTSGTSLALTATASSGLTVTFTSSTTSVCTVSGSTASLLAGGTCTLTASQAGNSSYSAATPVSQSFTVLQSQTITFNTIATQHVGTPLNLAGYATASSGLPITWTLVNNGNCSISGTTVTFINSGACGIIANQAGNSTYAAAAAVGQVVQVAAALQSQTITFKTIATQKVGTTLNVSSYATASSGLTVTFTVVNNGNCSISGTNVTFLNSGACGVIANQAGNSTYSAAAAVGQVVQVSN